MTPDIFDPVRTAISEDPYPAYRELRDNHPVYHARGSDVWVLSRFDDVQAAARDWQTFQSSPSVDLDDSSDIYGPGNFLDRDPPRHDELRNCVKSHFTPKSIAQALTPSVRETVDRLIQGFGQRNTVDVAAEFAWVLPAFTIADLLGIPKVDRPRVRDWILRLIQREPGSLHAPHEVHEAAQSITDYFAELIEVRRQAPRGDVISAIAEAVDDGRIRPDEISGYCMILVDAGTVTTASLISNGLNLLASYPDQRQLLIQQPTLIPAAIEEFLRFESPVQYLARRTTVPVHLHGSVIPAGSRVVLLYGSANRDERRFPEPERLDIMRAPMRHLAFGEGIHFCIGAPVARLETRIALEALLPKLGDYHITGPPIRTPYYPTLRGFASLIVRVE